MKEERSYKKNLGVKQFKYNEDRKELQRALGDIYSAMVWIILLGVLIFATLVGILIRLITS